MLKLTLLIIGAPLLAMLHNNTGNSDYNPVELKSAFEQSINWLQQKQ